MNEYSVPIRVIAPGVTGHQLASEATQLKREARAKYLSEHNRRAALKSWGPYGERLWRKKDKTKKRG